MSIQVEAWDSHIEGIKERHGLIEGGTVCKCGDSPEDCDVWPLIAELDPVEQLKKDRDYYRDAFVRLAHEKRRLTLLLDMWRGLAISASVKPRKDIIRTDAV